MSCCCRKHIPHCARQPAPDLCTHECSEMRCIPGALNCPGDQRYGQGREGGRELAKNFATERTAPICAGARRQVSTSLQRALTTCATCARVGLKPWPRLRGCGVAVVYHNHEPPALLTTATWVRRPAGKKLAPHPPACSRKWYPSCSIAAGPPRCGTMPGRRIAFRVEACALVSPFPRNCWHHKFKRLRHSRVRVVAVTMRRL